MKKSTKIIIFLIAAIIIVLPIYLLSGVDKKIENSKNTIENKIENKVKKDAKNETNETTNNTIENLIANVTENDVVENTTSNDVIENKTITINTVQPKNNIETSNQNSLVTEETQVNNPEEKARNIAKNDWGVDETVYFSYDGIDGASGNYIIGVRDKDTTYVKCWYYVNVKTEDFTVKR